MSNPQDKFKHSQRLHKSSAKQQAQVQIAKLHGLTPNSPHYYNKHHALDCGNPQCLVCGNPRRKHKHTLTKQEQQLFQTKLHEDNSDDPESTS